MSIRLDCGPLSQPWPKKETPGYSRIRGGFTDSYDTIIHDLLFELESINARDVTMQFDMRRDRFRRLDTLPYADGPVISPKVWLSFRKGDVRLDFPCDTYTTWLANLRAITLTLKSLRAVDRYGATSGQQYAGFRRLPPGGGEQNGSGPVQYTPEQAADLLAGYDTVSTQQGPAFRQALASNVLLYPHVFRIVEGMALNAAHPDKGGTPEQFHRVQQARDVLKRHHAEQAR